MRFQPRKTFLTLLWVSCLLKKCVILQNTIGSAYTDKMFIFNYKVLAATRFLYQQGKEGVKRFCYVTGEANNVLTLHPVTKEEEEVKILPKMALHNV